MPTLPFALSGDIGPPIRVDATVEVPHDFALTFIVGCGRSGTTLLGELLSQHREVAYLNVKMLISQFAKAMYRVLLRGTKLVPSLVPHDYTRVL